MNYNITLIYSSVTYVSVLLNGPSICNSNLSRGKSSLYHSQSPKLHFCQIGLIISWYWLVTYHWTQFTQNSAFACCQIEFYLNNTGQVPTENLIGIIIICFTLFQLHSDISIWEQKKSTLEGKGNQCVRKRFGSNAAVLSTRTALAQ